MSQEDSDFNVPLNERSDTWLRDRVVDMAQRLRAGDLGYFTIPSTTGPTGVIYMGGLSYEDWLWGGIWSAITLLCDRHNVAWEPYYDVPTPQDEIHSASLDQLGGWFNKFGNGERIFEGLITDGVDDGVILAMAERLLELVPAPNTEPPAPVPTWNLRFGDLLAAAHIDPADVLAIRHTYRPDGLGSPELATPEAVLTYTREQRRTQSKVPAQPPRWWFIFIAEGGRQCRLAYVYENRGLLSSDPAKNQRVFDLVPSDLVTRLESQLVIEWSKDAVNWAKLGTQASQFEVVEVADRAAVPFPGLDKMLVNYVTLQRVVVEPRYATWRAALASVKGIYLIADTIDGKLYVGKADGAGGVLERWKAYAYDGHGDNVEMLALAQQNADHPLRYQFSLLQVFGPATSTTEIDAAEEHWKRALLSRHFGMNQN